MSATYSDFADYTALSAGLLASGHTITTEEAGKTKKGFRKFEFTVFDASGNAVFKSFAFEMLDKRGHTVIKAIMDNHICVKSKQSDIDKALAMFKKVAVPSSQ